MNKLFELTAWKEPAALLLLLALLVQPLQAALTTEQQSAYQAVADELNVVNDTLRSTEDIVADTLWNDYHVSTEVGDDLNIGSEDQPWKTIQKALFTIPFEQDDATIIIHGGTYQIENTLFFGKERGGSEGKYFTLKAKKNEAVIIDGGLITEKFSAMVSLSSTAYVRLKGLTFANLRGPKSGIYVTGTSHHIRIINNTLRDMTWADDPGEDESSPLPSNNLNPIAIIGNHPTQPIHNIVIRGNELANIVPGYSEGIKIVGNVTDFVVAKNHVHDIANIGIVAAGNYTWVKDITSVKLYPDNPELQITIPAEVNHARNGVIRDNIVHHAISPIAISAGIYLDGARNVTVRGNRSYSNSVGFSIGSEQPGDATGNILRKNVAYNNKNAGLIVGSIIPDSVVKDTTVAHNEFRHNYTEGEYGGEMTIQSVNGLTVRNNVFSSLTDVLVVASQPATNLKLKNNAYFGASNDPKTATFDWGGIDGTEPYIGLKTYQAATCNDLNSVYQDEQSNHKKSKDKQLRKIKRACYRGNKIW